MADSTLQLLEAAQTALKASAEIIALVATRVHVVPPTNPTYPFVLVTCESQPYAADDFSGMEHRLRVQGFARENRPGTVLAIRAAAFEALNRRESNLALPSHDLVLCEHEGVTTYFPEDDGRTYQSVIEFKVLVN
ncbi:DUF3168 domain-containing protein [Sinorhizobium medicae]|uniref:DUF3168 domain-containing protein n=1 Tax=Sinorhizobium medicae TaxID=110321 RepID=UPI002AF6B3A3|nr:DUF3168 domain-containing protein [Sinorhizobium medicae]WQO60078.1 DUF3168 domain-containing protein [Sinorhizobium medicae]